VVVAIVTNIVLLLMQVLLQTIQPANTALVSLVLDNILQPEMGAAA
jgi:low affinity Fe/Cu permease